VLGGTDTPGWVEEVKKFLLTNGKLSAIIVNVKGREGISTFANPVPVNIVVKFGGTNVR
jgi:hypothetical protein